jgi:tetratricopeptide (TPR) repeat protein
MAESTPQVEAAISPAQLLDKFVGIFGRLFALFAGVATILYALGFFIVNTNLLRHGVYEFGLVKAQFVTAGLSYLFYLALLVSTAIVVHALVSWICDKWIRPRLRPREGEQKPNLIARFLNLITFDGQFVDEWIVVVLDIIVSPSVLLFLLASPIWRQWTAPGLSLLNDFEAVFTWAWMTLTLAWIYFLFIRPWIVDQVTTIGRMGISPVGRVALETVALFLALMPTLFLYGQNVYHRIPPSFGGGSPMIVQFVVDEDARARLQALGIVTNELGLTEKVELIAQSENRFIVLTQQEDRAVSLNTQDVQAIAYYSVGYRVTAQRYNEIGEQRARDERYEDAIAQYDQAILLDRGFLRAYINRGAAYLERAKRAREIGQQGGDQETFRRYIEAARKDCTQAIDVAAMFGDREHVVHLAYYHRARSYAIPVSVPEEPQGLGEAIEHAVDDLQKAIKLEPTDHDAVRTNHDFQPFLSQEQFVKAIFGNFENAAHEYSVQATDYKQKGNFKEAEWTYGQALNLIAQAYEKATDADKVKALLSEKASYHGGLADLYVKQAKWDLAAEEYEKAANDAPDNIAYPSEQVRALYSGRQLENATTVCQKWQKEFAAHPPASIFCGNVYRDSQNYEAAQISYTRAISAATDLGTLTDLAEAYYQRSRLYAKQSSAELFLQDLAEATRLSPFLIARSAFEPDFSTFKGDSRFLGLLYPTIERINVKDEMTLVFVLPAPSPAFQFQLIALMRLQGLSPLIGYQEQTGEVAPAQADVDVSRDGLVWTFRLRSDAPYKASELQAQLLQTLGVGQQVQATPEQIAPTIIITIPTHIVTETNVVTD